MGKKGKSRKSRPKKAARPGAIGAINRAITRCRKAKTRKSCERSIRIAATTAWGRKKPRNSNRTKRTQSRVTSGISSLFG